MPTHGPIEVAAFSFLVVLVVYLLGAVFFERRRFDRDRSEMAQMISARSHREFEAIARAQEKKKKDPATEKLSEELQQRVTHSVGNAARFPALRKIEGDRP